MLRKSLFWGLTLLLIAAIVNLIIRRPRPEKEQISKPVEVVRDAQPSPTRVLAPRDLEIVQSSMELVREGTANQLYSGRHEIEIRNIGKVAYREIGLRIVYFDRVGKVLTTKTQPLIKIILPGTTLKLPNILMTDIPASAVSCRVTTLYADVGSVSESGR